YLLVRTRHRLALVQTGSRIDPALCPLVGLDELKSRGRTELVRVVFPLTGLDAKDLPAVLQAQLGPFGEMTSAAGHLIARGPAGSLREFVKVVHALEQGAREATVTLDHKCRYVKAGEARKVLEQLLGGSPKDGAKGNRLALVSDDRTNTLHVRGLAEQV